MKDTDKQRAPSTEALRTAVAAGYRIGILLASMTPEERISFSLGLISAWDAPK